MQDSPGGLDAPSRVIERTSHGHTAIAPFSARPSGTDTPQSVCRVL
jgi:hypothetical protein